MRSAMVILFGLVWACCPSRAQTQQWAAGSDVLKDIGEFRVLVEVQDEEEMGLSVEELTTDVELRLRMAGVVVKDKDSCAGCPILSLQINSMEGEVFWVWSSDLQLCEIVTPIRDRNRWMLGSTWEVAGTHGFLPKREDLRQEAREEVASQVDAFLNDYLKANPRSAPGEPR